MNVKVKSFISILSIILIVAGFLSSCKSSHKYKESQVKEKRLKRKDRKHLTDNVISTSKKYMGTPYKWGGTTRAGMDCSGLLYTSYRLNNIEIPRSSADQSNFGKRVSLGNLREGDWVFFATGKKRRKVTHVGMVVDVRGREDVKFIHASTSLGVTESQLFSDYWRKKIVKAVRPFK